MDRRGTRSRSDVAMEPQLILLSTITRRRTIRQKEKGSGGGKEMEIHLEQSQSVQPRQDWSFDGALSSNARPGRTSWCPVAELRS